ncbi:MAG: phosphatase PAP2 family protein [Saprospiraceae bacterium]|nr:phosphatase PAP2 family protein [Saprospiraceae bacterium]
MIKYFSQLDHELFEWIQMHMRNSFLDPIFLAARDKLFWIPLYIILISWVGFKFGRQAWKLFLLILITIIVTDQMNSTLLKKLVRRDRPCNEVYFKDQFVPVLPCSGGYSFPSSHATNHMGIAVMIILTCGRYLGPFKWLFLVWALLIGFSQIYVGVHFPIDIAVGFLEGALLAFTIYSMSQKTKFFKLKEEY